MMKRVLLNPFAGAAMLMTGMAVSVLHHDWTAVALIIAGFLAMIVSGQSLPGARQ